MAYAVKYVFTFQSVGGTTREIRILKDGYSGDPIRRALGRAPILKKQQNGPVHGTSLEMYAECHVDQEFIEFYTSDPKEYRVELYAGNALLWQGWITPELYSEPDIAPPYDVQVVATDGVGELKLYDFAAQGMVSLRAMLTYLLGKTGLSTDVFLVSSLKAGSAGAGALLDMEANFDYLVGKTCYEALSYLLTTLHATITWWGGHWMLVRENNVTFTSGKVRYFNTAGNSALLANSVQELGSMYQDAAWPVGQLSTVVDPAKNKVVVQAPWHPVTALQNSDMASDASWNKSGVTYDSTKGAYFFARDVIMAGELAQSVAFGGLRVPMRMTLSGCGTSETGSGFTGTGNGWVGLILKFQDGDGNVYYLGVDGDGNRRWELYDSGRIPRAFEQDLLSVDTDRENADRIELDIPALAVDGGFPSGTLTVGIWGGAVYVFSAHLDVVLNKGYQDILHIDNGARGEGDDTEIAFGRVTSDVAYYQAFVQGILLNNGALITAFSDANFTTGLDFLSFISRDYARSVALPRARVEGTVSLESSVQLPPLVFTKGGLDYWLETWSWNLYEDELQISARTLPTATLTVESETITEAGGTASTGSSSGGASSTPVVGLNYFEPNEGRASLIQLKPAYDYLGPRKGLVFGSNSSEDANVDLEVVTMNIGGTDKRVLHTKLPIVSDDFMSAFGASDTPGASGIDAEAMWALLGASTNEQIAASHLQTAFGTLNLGAAATYGIGQVASGNNGLVTGGAVFTYVTGVLSSVLKFQGTTTTAISDGSTTNPITINGASYTAQKGDVVLYDGKEYLWQGSSWEQLGDESSWALKTTTISAGTGLAGGGSLAANRTIRLSDASIASLGHADDAYSYFTNGVANSAARLSGNTAYSVWGVEFWSNGVPKSATAQPNLYVGDTKVATSAQTAMNIGGLGILTLANGSGIRFADNPAEGATAQNLTALQFTTTNKLLIGFDTSTAGAETILYGSTIYFRYGTGHTNGLILDSTALTSYRDIIPASNGTRNLGSASAMWKYTYTNRLYLDANTYFTVDSDGNVHLVQPSGKGFWADGFMSAFGLSSTQGGGGLDPEVMWAYLRNTATDATYNNAKIHTAHLPSLTANNGLTASYSGTPDNTALTIGVGSGYKLPTTTEWGNKQDKYDFTITGTSGSTYNLANFVTSAVTNVAVGGSGHTDELAVTKDGTTSYLTVPYATNAKRFKRYVGTDEAGGYDLNTLLSGGGITSQYNSMYTWGNGPDGMSFGGVVQLNPNVNQSLAMQLAWDVVHNATTQTYKTGKLWWRDATYHDGAADWGEWHLIYDDTTLTKAVVAGLLDDGNGTYVKLNPGSAEQTISSNISTLEKGVVNLWRKSGDHFTFLGFSNGTTETYLGGIGFKSQSDHNLYRKDGSNYYKIWDASNANLSTIDWAAKDLTAAGALSVTGAASVNKLTIASTAGEAHIAFGRGGYNYITTPASGVLNIVTGGRSLSLANSTAVFTDTDIRPGANATYSLGTGSYCWEGIYGRYLELKKNGGASLVFRGTTTLNNQVHTILFKGGTDSDSNGFKIETVPATSYGCQSLGFYTSNVASGSAPYTPDWKRSMFISHNGNVYVGASDYANQLVVYGTATIGTATATSSAALTVSGAIYASTGIWSDGYMSAYGVASSSDARLKDNIKDFAYTPELLMSLKPREWDWNGKANIKGHAAGFVAQEVEPHLPYAVTERVYKQLFYNTLHAIEMSGLQDHERRIKALEEENKQLKEEIKRLRAI